MLLCLRLHRKVNNVTELKYYSWRFRISVQKGQKSSVSKTNNIADIVSDKEVRNSRLMLLLWTWHCVVKMGY